MKIIFIKHQIDFADDDIQKAISFFKEKTPLDISYEVIEAPQIKLAYTMFLYSEFHKKYLMGTYKVKEQIRELVPENEYHVACFIYDRSQSIYSKTPGFEVACWSYFKPLYPRTEFVEIATDGPVDAQDWTWKLIAHEIMHAFVKRAQRAGRNVFDEMDETIIKGKKYPYHHNDDPYNSDGNFAHTLQNLEGHWDMVDYFPKTKKKWEYFTENEVKGLKEDFVEKLDMARGIAGVPFIITSGYRSEAQNEAVGGIKDSEHITGYGVDLAATDNEKRHKILDALYTTGFERIGIYDRHIHVGDSPTHPRPRTWVGISK